jgi:hypothetical protein
MIRFYPHAPDTNASGSPSYAQTLLRLNYQYFLTGLIEIQYGVGEQLVLLISEGRDAGAFHIHGNNCLEINPVEIQSYWKSGNGSIRSISLPRNAVRAARQVLEWSPPAQSLTAESNEVIGDYIETCKAQRANGLFHFLWARSEGYLNLYFGQLLPMDSIFSNTSGTDTGEACLKLILSNQDSPCRITFLESRPNSLSYQLLTLRVAIGKLLAGILEKYENQLGPGLAKALVSDLNPTVRLRPWYLEIAGKQLEDTHVFSSMEEANEAYQTMMKHITVHMYNVAGKNETHNLLSSAFHSIQPNLQQTIQKYALLPAMANTK